MEPDCWPHSQGHSPELAKTWNLLTVAQARGGGGGVIIIVVGLFVASFKALPF